jgi:hypothetical protein
MSQVRPLNFPPGFCFKHNVGTCAYGKKCKHSHGALPGGYKLPSSLVSTSEKTVKFRGKCNFCKKAGHKSSDCRTRGTKGRVIVSEDGAQPHQKDDKESSEEAEEGDGQEGDEQEAGTEQDEARAPGQVESLDIEANVDFVTDLVNKSLAASYIAAHGEDDGDEEVLSDDAEGGNETVLAKLHADPEGALWAKLRKAS